MPSKGAVVVAGADTVVGAACVAHFAGAGHRVVALVSDGDFPGAHRSVLEATGGDVALHRLDLTDEDALAAVAAEVGPVGALVNAHFALDTDADDFDSMTTFAAVLRTNVLGPAIATRVCTASLAAAAPSGVVHVGSIDGTLGYPLVPAYSASKGAVAALTHVQAATLAPGHPRQRHGPGQHRRQPGPGAQ